MKNTRLKIEDSLLTRYVSDVKNDGTYTLNLTNAETLALWDKVDAQTLALQACVATMETALDYGDFNRGKCEFAKIAARDLKAGIAALQKTSAAPSNK